MYCSMFGSCASKTVPPQIKKSPCHFLCCDSCLSHTSYIIAAFTLGFGHPGLGIKILYYRTKKMMPFHYRGLECKVGSQGTPGVTGKFGLGIWNEAGQRLIEFCQENTLVITNTLFQQHKRRLYIWTSPDGHHWNQNDCILCNQKWRSSIQSAKTRPGADWEWLRSWPSYYQIQT